jgi:putative ABC transport system ATP-binding protein
LSAGSLRSITVIVVTHDHRPLDVFDTIYEIEDGMIRKQDRPAS